MKSDQFARDFNLLSGRPAVALRVTEEERWINAGIAQAVAGTLLDAVGDPQECRGIEGRAVKRPVTSIFRRWPFDAYQCALLEAMNVHRSHCELPLILESSRLRLSTQQRAIEIHSERMLPEVHPYRHVPPVELGGYVIGVRSLPLSACGSGEISQQAHASHDGQCGALSTRDSAILINGAERVAVSKSNGGSLVAPRYALPKPRRVGDISLLLIMRFTVSVSVNRQARPKPLGARSAGTEWRSCACGSS